MLSVEAVQRLAPADLAVLDAIERDATVDAGHPVIGEAIWRDAHEPVDGSRSVVARRDGQLVGVGHLAATTTVPPHLELGLVVSPGEDRDPVARELVARAVEAARASPLGSTDGAALTVWILGVERESDAIVRDAGFVPDRELWQMRVPLPLRETARWPEGFTVRTFEPGHDDDAWVAVNNRAFAGHPEQGGWTGETLRQRARESWFDPRDFLLAFDQDLQLAGFCWTKVHPAAPPIEPAPLGEIYVIGVDPDRQGTGLGRALVVGGLEAIAEHGITAGMLFVDSANAAAVGLYEAIGFARHRVDRAYVHSLSATS
ncbi:MAG: mycothiol synthase [Actinobacteria bacterium]|nr:MAG: mycothiol synthase [Actinomycetota bacterium]